MPNISQMIDALLTREGGYVNDPDDPGGATNFGITIHTLSQVRGRRVSPQEVKNLRREEARAIYEKIYYQKPRIDELPAKLQPSVFDMYVNSGTRAIKILQGTLNKFGENLTVDGGNGPLTLAAAQRVDQIAGNYLVDAYGIERREYYYRLADRRAASRKYARTRAGGKGGWIKRAEEFIAPRYHFSENDHRTRTANWS